MATRNHAQRHALHTIWVVSGVRRQSGEVVVDGAHAAAVVGVVWPRVAAKNQGVDEDADGPHLLLTVAQEALCTGSCSSEPVVLHQHLGSQVHHVAADTHALLGEKHTHRRKF